jgi:hypothetical protein
MATVYANPYALIISSLVRSTPHAPVGRKAKEVGREEGERRMSKMIIKR